MVLARAAFAKLAIIAGAVCYAIWRVKFMKAFLKLQHCYRGWKARNSNEHSRRRSHLLCLGRAASHRSR